MQVTGIEFRLLLLAQQYASLSASPAKWPRFCLKDEKRSNGIAVLDIIGPCRLRRRGWCWL
jgi:hypothetical protein